MSERLDIAKHLVYSAWILTIIQMLRVAGGFLLSGYFIDIVAIFDAAFDCALILFSIGLIRLGKSIEGIKYWILSACLLCSAAIIDIIAIIISYSNLANNWDIPPLLYVRLVILIFYYVILVSGFLVLKFTIDSLYKNNYIPRKGQWYIPVGIAVYFIPTIINWYSLVVYPNELYNWIQNVSLSLFFFAAFLIILGFFGLSVTMNMFRSGEYLNEELIENNEISDVEKNEEIET